MIQEQGYHLSQKKKKWSKTSIETSLNFTGLTILLYFRFHRIIATRAKICNNKIQAEHCINIYIDIFLINKLLICNEKLAKEFWFVQQVYEMR